jgi:hypothetical protein
MTRVTLLASFAVVLFSSGCDQPKPVLPPPPPHGGIAYSLPKGSGFVEVLKQEEQQQQQSGEARLVLYFMDNEHKPLRTAPSKASFQPRGKKVPRISLAATGDSELSSASQLASAPFADPGEITGTISATIDGEPISIAISVR